MKIRAFCGFAGCSMLWAFAGVASAGAEAVPLQLPSVANGSAAEAVVTNVASASGVVLGGTVRKFGAGALSVTGSLFAGGAIEVEQGSLALQADSSLASWTLPQSLLTNSLLLWVDATTNVVTDGGSPARVLRWQDVRETNTAAPAYLYAGQHDPEPGPTLASRAWLGAQTYLEFGNMQSNGCWLSLMQPGAGGAVTSNKYLTAKALFAVRGTQGAAGYHGFFFGDWTGVGNGGNRNFHTGSSGATQAPLWAEEAADGLRNGATCLDGRRVNGYTEYPNDWYQLVGVNMPSGSGQLSNFFNDRNYKPPVTNFRQGGGQLAEVLLFGNALSENDRLTVEGYLQGKWFGRTQDGTVRARAGASAVLTAGAGETLTLSGLEGEGAFCKGGAGTLRLRKNAGLPPRTLLLQDGALSLGPLVTRTDALVEVSTNAAADFAAGGRRVTVADGSYACTTNLEAGVLAKDGAGEWAVANVPDGVKTVRVEGGTLRVMPRPAAAHGVSVGGTIPNPSFETTGALGSGSWAYSPSGAQWTFMPQTKITEIDSTNQVDKGAGLVRAGVSGSPWLAPAIATWDGGLYVAFVQRSGTLQEMVTLPEPGVYKLSFAHARRTSNSPHLLEVWFDGAVVGMAEAGSDLFVRREMLLPYRAAGTYALLFQGVHREAGDRTSLIDDVRLERVEDGSNIVTDGSFEGTGALSQRLAGQTRYELGAVLNGRGWAFSDAITNLLANANNVFGTNVAAAGVAEDLGGWMVTPADGGRAACIFGDGQLAVTLAFPTSGVYRVSFLGAGGAGGSTLSRAGAYASVNAMHKLNLKLDGVTVMPITLGPPAFQRYDITLPPVTNGQVSVLTFAGNTGTNTYSRIGLIDDVRVTRVGPTVVQNAGFETPYTGGIVEAPSGGTWSFTSTAESGNTNIKSGLTTARQAFAFAVPQGRQAAFLQMTAYIRQTVTFPEDGVYTVSFMAAARTEGSYAHVGHDFALQLDGVTVGTVTTTGYLYDRYTFRLPYVKAGVSHLLAFQGLNTAGGDRSSAIDDVRVERLAVEDGAYAPFSPELTVELAEGAKLALDFAGTQPLHALRVGGRAVSGEISAASRPGVITGIGTLLVPASGTLFFLQ